MLIQWITLENYRNYRTLTLSPEPTLNVLSGPNAQGKTNFLEALGVLLVGRSFRGAKAADLARWDAPAASLSGELARMGSPQVYGASGRTAAPNPKLAPPLAVSRLL